MTYSPEARRNTIGASDIPILLGLSPYADASPWSILHREGRPDTPAQALGRSLEAWLVDMSMGGNLRGLGNDEVIIRDGWAHATPDGCLWGKCDCIGYSHVDGCTVYDAPIAVIEAKNVSWAKAADWRNGVPSYVYAQVQWQMWVTGAPLAIVSALVAGEYQRHEVPRDEAFLAEAIPIARAFWTDMQMGVDPPLDASHACGAALRARLEGREDDPAVDATEEQTELWGRYSAAKAAAKNYDSLARELSASLLQSMQGPLLLQSGHELRSTKQGLRIRKARP